MCKILCKKIYGWKNKITQIFCDFVWLQKEKIFNEIWFMILYAKQIASGKLNFKIIVILKEEMLVSSFFLYIYCSTVLLNFVIKLNERDNTVLLLFDFFCLPFLLWHLFRLIYFFIYVILIKQQIFQKCCLRT